MNTFRKWLFSGSLAVILALSLSAPAAAFQYGAAVNTARLNAVVSTIGTTPKLQIWTGSIPANCAATATGTKLVDSALPSTWATVSGATLSKAGTWSLTGIAAGTAGYFRILDSTGTTCGIQGTITATGSGGDMTLDNTSIATSQSVTVNTFSISAGNQ